MDEIDRDTLIRMAAVEHVRRLIEIHAHLTANELKPSFVFDGERIPIINPQRGIFKPREMRFLLSIKTVFPKPGGKVWYDDQREVHRQIFAGDETVDWQRATDYRPGAPSTVIEVGLRYPAPNSRSASARSSCVLALKNGSSPPASKSTVTRL